MNEIFIPCLIEPTKCCPQSCSNHEIAREFRTYIIETLVYNLGRQPTEEEMKKTWEEMPLSNRIPVERGTFDTIGRCKQYSDETEALREMARTKPAG